MKTLSDRLNLSLTKDVEWAVRIDKHRDVNFFDTLCLYCANDNINTDIIDDDDFIACADIIADFASNDMGSDHYYFWIEE